MAGTTGLEPAASAEQLTKPRGLPRPRKSLKIAQEVACCGLICGLMIPRRNHQARRTHANSLQRKATFRRCGSYALSSSSYYKKLFRFTALTNSHAIHDL